MKPTYSISAQTTRDAGVKFGKFTNKIFNQVEMTGDKSSAGLSFPSDKSSRWCGGADVQAGRHLRGADSGCLHKTSATRLPLQGLGLERKRDISQRSEVKPTSLRLLNGSCQGFNCHLHFFILEKIHIFERFYPKWDIVLGRGMYNLLHFQNGYLKHFDYVICSSFHWIVWNARRTRFYNKDFCFHLFASTSVVLAMTYSLFVIFGRISQVQMIEVEIIKKTQLLSFQCLYSVAVWPRCGLRPQPDTFEACQ